MVGRDAELELLESLVDVAAAGRGRIAVLVGEPGIGKSRLLRELRTRTSERDGSGWALGRSLSFGRQMPYHLVTSLVGALVEATEIDDPDSVVRTLHERGESLDLDEATRDDLAELTGASVGKGAGEQARLSAYRHALAALIRARARRHVPLVLVCEDVHWADPSSAELLAELVPGCHDQPVLLILTSRPERSTPGWAVVESARSAIGEALTEIDLQPLRAEDAREMVAHLLEIEDLPESLRSLVLDKAEGNPFFVEEVVRMLIERNAIERRGDRWIANDEVTKLEVPDTVEALVASRVDRLPEPARATARLAAVIGRSFPASLVEQLDPAHGDGSMHPQLGVLEAHGLIRLSATRPEIEYAFRHALVQEVIYSSILKRERKLLHARVAEALERRHAEHADDFAALLAHHYDEADDPRALRYLVVAGKRALARYANQEAFAHFDRARRRLRGDDEETRRMRLECALDQYRAGLTFIPTGTLLELLEPAVVDAEELGDPTLLLRLHLALVRVLNEAGHNYGGSEMLRRSLDESLRLGELVEDPELRALPKVHMGEVRLSQGEFDAAFRLWCQAVPELERTSNLVVASFYAGMASRALAYLGEFDEAEQWVDRSRTLANATGDPNAILDADLFAGWLEADRGNLVEALEFTQRAIEAADEVGNIACSMMGNMLAGNQQLRMGEPEAALAFLTRGNELAEYCEVGRDTIALSEAWLAQARARLGEPSLPDLDAALEAAKEVRNPLNEGLILLERATVRLLSDPPPWELAFADFEAAETIFDKIGARPFLARSLRDHGAALELAGQTTEAEPLMRRAAELFAAMGLTVD
jgi:tetratricopeptide (TPR) repeat protein